MKKLYVIGGTMGVGKTTISKYMKSKLNNCVFLDGDVCWDSHPFIVNDETRKIVVENIKFMLNNFIKSKSYENIVFCWVLHKQEIIDDILEGLDLHECEVINISLVCDEKTLMSRLKSDVEKGIRNEEIVLRSVGRLGLYESLDTIKIDTTSLNVDEIYSKIVNLKGKGNKCEKVNKR